MILIIDDDKAVQTSLRLLLRRQGLESAAVSRPAQALAFLERQRPDIILLDMNFTVETSGEEGLKLLRQILRFDPSLPVILITGWATMQLAIEGMKAGARDFISKPWSNEYLLQSIQTILSLAAPAPPSAGRRQLDRQYDFSRLIGEDPDFVKVLEMVGRVADTDASVLILGESGTGKELIAEAIHHNSRRREKPFVKVNLGGISSPLFESEMFGHKRGAFTDARYDRKGRFTLAHTGTIFLDEIGELDLTSQVKLLRVLQDRRFEVLGGNETQQIDVRIICATNRDLAGMVAKGTFREDLFYRINLITVELPALRKRPTDIPLLADFYIQNLKTLYQRPGLTVSLAAKTWLQQYSFPGNIRQLKNLVERTVLITPKDRLETEDFQTQITTVPRRPDTGNLPEVGAMSLEEMEKEMIQKAMTHYNQRITKVAQALGLTRSALYRRLDKYDIPYEKG